MNYNLQILAYRITPQIKYNRVHEMHKPKIHKKMIGIAV